MNMADNILVDRENVYVKVIKVGPFLVVKKTLPPLQTTRPATLSKRDEKILAMINRNYT